jgi:hypothetical protein
MRNCTIIHCIQHPADPVVAPGPKETWDSVQPAEMAQKIGCSIEMRLAVTR